MKAFAFESLHAVVSECTKISQQTQAIRVMLRPVKQQCDFTVEATFHSNSKLSCQHIKIWRYQNTSPGHETRMGLTKLDRLFANPHQKI